MPDNSEYKYLKFKEGTVTVKPSSRKDWSGSSVQIILLAGPTGAGKSSFLEALSGDKSLGISKNQLAGVTQAVVAYEIQNAVFQMSGEDDICLLDSPGFSDSEISDSEIVEMVKKWLADHNANALHNLLYFCPITDIRLPGSRRKTIEMLKSFIKASSSSVDLTNNGSLTVVTTMWDNVWNDRTEQRAEKNYTQLKDVVFKDMISKGAGIVRFMNTQKSSFDILDACREHWGKASGNAYSAYRNEGALGKTFYGYLLYADLLGRVEQAQQLKRILEFDLTQTRVLEDSTLTEITEASWQANERLLRKFKGQVKAFGEPPDGMPMIVFEDVSMSTRLREAIRRQRVKLKIGWVRGPRKVVYGIFHFKKRRS
ncbi:hypothetical protein CVT24_007688 [Panaeolus cyanescens]|uniref:G domain-containing protein n=1 Tax=Panaeolus cyanescens TaxID=181874 RepID=A0A409VRL2_9AGAR|nr:hypothetical protein CVT24_007688 [Panaeolus cyanescens]